jgi:hypothetical protein
MGVVQSAARRMLCGRTISLPQHSYLKSVDAIFMGLSGQNSLKNRMDIA